MSVIARVRLMRRRAERHTPPSDYLSAELAWFDPPSWIGVATLCLSNNINFIHFLILLLLLLLTDPVIIEQIRPNCHKSCSPNNEDLNEENTLCFCILIAF